ncbi:hypothetical protein C8J56DRAFT_170377 [Mycena floridula]|nr:hypothetical protein C8J56DRAFT_170377 [Mycena floridula]
MFQVCHGRNHVVSLASFLHLTTMSFRTVLKRLMRMTLYLWFIWVLVAIVWMLLPAPTRDASFPDKRLNSGGVLHRIYTTLDYYPYTDRSPTVVNSRAGGRALDLEFKVEDGLLVLGTSLDAWYDVRRHGYRGDVLPQQKIALSISSSDDHRISVSKPLNFTTQTSDSNIPLPPWVDDADAASISWWFEHDWLDGWSWQQAVTTTIRTRIVSAERTIEFWPDSSYWYRVHSTDGTPPGLSPLLTIKLADDASPTFQFPPAPFSSSPSAFYTTRVTLLFFLVPVFLLYASIFYIIALVGYGIFLVLSPIFLIVSTLSDIVGAILVFGLKCTALLVLVWWWKNGRPTRPFIELKDAFVAAITAARLNHDEEDRQTDNLESQPVDEEVQTADVYQDDPGKGKGKTAVLVDVSEST